MPKEYQTTLGGVRIVVRWSDDVAESCEEFRALCHFLLVNAPDILLQILEPKERLGVHLLHAFRSRRKNSRNLRVPELVRWKFVIQQPVPMALQVDIAALRPYSAEAWDVAAAQLLERIRFLRERVSKQPARTLRLVQSNEDADELSA